MGERRCGDRGMGTPTSDAGVLVQLGDARELPDVGPHRAVWEGRDSGMPVALVTVIATSGSAPRGVGSSMALSGHDGISFEGGHGASTPGRHRGGPKPAESRARSHRAGHRWPVPRRDRRVHHGGEPVGSLRSARGASNSGKPSLTTGQGGCSVRAVAAGNEGPADPESSIGRHPGPSDCPLQSTPDR